LIDFGRRVGMSSLTLLKRLNEYPIPVYFYKIDKHYFFPLKDLEEWLNTYIIHPAPLEVDLEDYFYDLSRKISRHDRELVEVEILLKSMAGRIRGILYVFFCIL
jgi:hypothetical protein